MSFSFIGSLSLSILLVIISKLNFNAPLASILNTLTNPLLRPITALRSKKDSLTSFLGQTPTLYSENQKLKLENNFLKIQIQTLTNLISDQNQLKTLSDHSWQSQPVKLVSLDNLAIFTSLNFANIRPGQPVASGNSLVGLVQSVEPPIIKVIPLNHKDAKLTIKLDTGAKGDYIYQNNEPRVTNLENTISFNSQTTIFTLPTNLIPENLIIGQLDKIITDSANPTQTTTITLDSDIAKAHDFYIITKP